MKARGITTYALIEKYRFSRNTIYRLKHGFGMSTILLNDLCEILNCKVEDVIEYVPDGESENKEGPED